MREPVIRGVGLVASLAYAAAVAWLYATQPQTVAQVTGGFASIVGAYHVDPQAFADGLRFFRGNQFVEARAALLRADPAERDAPTQFYIAYAYYREGWGRLYNDDVLFGKGLAAVDKAIALAPGGRLVVDDADLQMHSADELRAELQRGVTRDASDLNPLRVFGGAEVSAIREAVVLPLIFLTVTLLAGVQLSAGVAGVQLGAGAQTGAGVALAPPSLFTLVLGTMLLAALVRSGALAPDRLLHGSRLILANANGAVVLVTLFAAAAQLLGMLTPRSGLPLFFVSIFLFVLLLNTLVAQPDRVRLLRSLAVILGSALVLKFVILASLSGPSGSRTTRVLVALFDAATFGTIAQEPQSPGGGYLAFFATGLFLIGTAALPAARDDSFPGTALQAYPPR